MDLISNNLISTIIKEFNKKENRRKLNMHILEPIINEFVIKSYPYAVIHVVLQFIIICLLVLILYNIRK